MNRIPYRKRSEESRPSVVADRSRFRTAALLMALVTAGAARAADTDTLFPGDTMIVAKDKVELGLRDKVSTVLSVGDKIHVTEVRGAWIGGYALVDGERHTGWVHQTEVKLLGTSPKDIPRIEAPDKPDDAKAVETLKRLGVLLDLNEKGNVHTADATEAKIADGDLAHFQGLHHLSTLDLSGRPITDEGMKSLAGLGVLQKLYLDNTQITDEGLKSIESMAHLEVFAMTGAKVVGPGLVHLTGLANLYTLNLTDCQVTDDALAHLEKLPHLEVLALPGTKITSAGLAHLKPVAKLRVLNLIGCEVDDTGLEHLRGLTNLRMLYVRKTKVTQEAVDKFKEDSPSLAIYRN